MRSNRCTTEFSLAMYRMSHNLEEPHRGRTRKLLVATIKAKNEHTPKNKKTLADHRNQNITQVRKILKTSATFHSNKPPRSRRRITTAINTKREKIDIEHEGFASLNQIFAPESPINLLV